MNKLKIILTILSISITVLPIAGAVLAYRDNLIGLVMPPEVISITDGSITNSSQFQPPMPVGEPQYNPETKTATFTFNFTNPLNSPMTINTLEAGIKCGEHGFLLGNASIDKPLTLNPGESAVITAFGKLSDDAINHFKTQHAGDNYVNVDFSNLNVDIAGIKVQVDEQEIGNIPIPPELLG